MPFSQAPRAAAIPGRRPGGTSTGRSCGGGPGKAGSLCDGMSKEAVRQRCEHTGLLFMKETRKRDELDTVIVADLNT